MIMVAFFFNGQTTYSIGKHKASVKFLSTYRVIPTIKMWYLAILMSHNNTHFNCSSLSMHNTTALSKEKKNKGSETM